MTPANLALPDITRGDTWEGIPNIGPITVDGLQPANPVTSARLMFRRTPDSTAIGYELNTVAGTGKGTITVVSAPAWQFTIPKQPLPLAAGDWTWDFEITDSATTVFTYLAGTLRVRADNSR